MKEVIFLFLMCSFFFDSSTFIDCIIPFVDLPQREINARVKLIRENALTTIEGDPQILEVVSKEERTRRLKATNICISFIFRE